MTEHDEKRTNGERLVVSGIEIEVTNPALAASLSGRSTASRVPPESERLDHRTVAQAVPDSLIAVPTPHGRAEERARRDLRVRVAAAGAAMGFEVGTEGSWVSGTGITILTRANARKLTPAAAVYFVDEIVRSVRREYERGSVLFVVAHRETTEAFTVAIRHRRAGDTVRVIAVEHLERLAALCVDGSITHDDAVAVLAPISCIDAGTVVDALLRACPRRGE